MKINLLFSKLAAEKVFFLLSIAFSIVHGGPPLQGEIPIGTLPAEYEVFGSPGGRNEGKNFDKNRINFSVNNYKQEETYRLPLSIQPVHYDLEIRPIFDQGEDQLTAPGKVAIRVKCFNSTDSITLHSKGIDIEHDAVTVVGVDPAEGNVAVTGHREDIPRNFYIINLDRNLTVNQEYWLTIPFIAPIYTPEQRMAGLYLSRYEKSESSQAGVLATTQFQKDSASYAFPCFDEPSEAFRATFNVKVGRKAQGFHSLTNTERIGEPEPIPGVDGWVWDSHNTTMSLPTYLIAFIVSDFESETAPANLYGKPVKTWAAPPLMTDTSGKFSAQAAARILSFFEEYFDYPYGHNKMDSVAVPDFAAGAMENEGLNTYRTNLMVWFEEENTQFEKWRSAAVIAHELTHQWFGNLATCEWWNDLWLNEGFARYFQFIAANHSGQDFRSLDRYVIDVTQIAMDNDVLSSTEPIHSNVTDRVISQNSRIIYEKAAAVIRMMQTFLTEETLIKGLRNYLKEHAFGGVVQDDLFEALTKQAEADGTFTRYTVKQVMDTWTMQSGFPLIRVRRVSENMLYISQENFLLDIQSQTPADEGYWYVPLSYVTQSNPDFSPDNARPKDWIDDNTILQPLTVDSTDQWIIFNPDARSFYRVLYDDHMINLIQQQLQRNHTVISLGSRSQLIDDYFKSASSKYVNIQYALNLTSYLSEEDDFIVWTTVFNNLLPLYNKIVDTPALDNFKTYVLSLIIDPLERITPTQKPEDPVDVAVLRTLLLDWACSLSHDICSKTATDYFTEWMRDPTVEKVPVPTDIQPMIYCGAVATSNDPAHTEIQDFLSEEYERNRGTRQQTLIVDALACDQNADNLNKLLMSSIGLNPGSKLNATVHGLRILERVAANAAGRELIFNFLTLRHPQITAIHGDMAVPTIISRLATYLSNRRSDELLERVQTFIDAYLAEDIPQNVRNSLVASNNVIQANSQWMNFFYEDVRDGLAALLG